MTTLAAQVGGGHDDAPVATSHDGRALAAGELRAGGVSALVGEGARVALCLRDPLDLIRALAALDGQVAALLLLSPSFPPETVEGLAQRAGCTVLVADEDRPGVGPRDATPLAAVLGPHRRPAPLATEWLLTTSGTTGLPKLVPHTFGSLTRTTTRFAAPPLPVWGLLYDPTRFAGLQVVLQALVGGGRLVLADTHAPLGRQVEVLAREGVTHLSATPTLWRRLLMVPEVGRLPLRQATLGGEIADQSTLQALRAAFPAARVTHIYASTEAGVGFSVTDGRMGFPAAFLQAAPGGVRLRVADGMLWLRPPVATGPAAGIEVDAEGFVRTGDLVREEGDRVLFLGRENGLINVGGVKVHPEAVEAVIATVPGVALAQVSGKRSPVTGALVVAAVQLAPGADAGETRAAIVAACAARLDREAVPAIIRFVEGFQTNAAGKLVRTG